MKSRIEVFLAAAVSSLCRPFLMKKRHNSGVRSLATANEHAKSDRHGGRQQANETHRRAGKRETGETTPMIVKVEARRRHCISVADLQAASSRGHDMIEQFDVVVGNDH